MANNGLQSFYLSAGSEACYLFSIIDIAEEYTGFTFDFKTVAQMASLNGYIKIDWNNLLNKDNFWVTQPTEILKMLTGKIWRCTQQDASYKPKKTDYVVMKYVKDSFGHFRRPNFDSIQNSQTVKLGKLDSYRIFEVVK